jgi:hypothetical protein
LVFAEQEANLLRRQKTRQFGSNEEVFGLNGMSWFPANFYFPANPKNMNQNSPLLTSQQNWNTPVINVRVSPILVKQEELISRAGSFVVLEKLERNLLEMDSLEIKSGAESFFLMEITGNLSNRLTCVGTVWCCFGFLVFEALRGNSRWNLGLKWGKVILLSFTIFFQKFWNFQWISGDDFNNSAQCA